MDDFVVGGVLVVVFQRGPRSAAHLKDVVVDPLLLNLAFDLPRDSGESDRSSMRDDALRLDG